MTHTRSKLINAWLATVTHYIQPVLHRDALDAALSHPHWRNRRDDSIFRKAVALQERLEDICARRYPLAGE